MGEGAGDAIVLLDEKAAGQLVLRRALDAARSALEVFVSYPYLNLGMTIEVLYPVRAIPAAGEHVENFALYGEPDLDLVQLTRYAPDRRQVAEVFVG